MYSFAGNRLYGVRLVLIFLSFVASLLVTTSISTINILRVNFNNGSALEGSNRTHGLESVSVSRLLRNPLKIRSCTVPLSSVSGQWT